MGKIVDIKGKKFGRLTALEYVGADKYGNPMWLCVCECGTEKVIRQCHLINNHTISCGCYNRENNWGKARHTTHGKYYTKLYKTWRGIISRCYNKNSSNYINYGGRGIIVCDEWRNDFMSFYNWSYDNGYKEELSIERINVNGNYEPSNCCWIPLVEQANNKTCSRRYTVNGETLNLKQLSKKYNVEYKKLFARVTYLGWSIEDAIQGKNTRERKSNRN